MGKFVKGNKGGGRKGYGLELQKKRVLDQAFHTLKMSMMKGGTELKEKEKIDIDKQIVLKEIGKNIDITSGGKELKPVLVEYLNGKTNNKNTN